MESACWLSQEGRNRSMFWASVHGDGPEDEWKVRRPGGCPGLKSPLSVRTGAFSRVRWQCCLLNLPVTPPLSFTFSVAFFPASPIIPFTICLLGSSPVGEVPSSGVHCWEFFLLPEDFVGSRPSNQARIGQGTNQAWSHLAGRVDKKVCPNV